MTKEEALFKYLLRLADANAIQGHRLAEWCGHGPMLEEDLALTNISLDMIGQAQALYLYAAKTEGKGKSEDDLAFFRPERQFLNPLITELPKGDFGFTIARLYLTSVYNFHLYTALCSSADSELAALAAKGLKEVKYHLRHSKSWMERLGDGTAESHKRMQNAIDELWRFTGELFEMNEVDQTLHASGIVPDLNAIYTLWNTEVAETLKTATLKSPENVFMQRGSRDGRHTEHMGFILAEMQSLARTYPDAKW